MGGRACGWKGATASTRSAAPARSTPRPGRDGTGRDLHRLCHARVWRRPMFIEQESEPGHRRKCSCAAAARRGRRMNEKMITTYSMWSKFRNCRKACEWRYLKELVPLSAITSLDFGSVIHDCLELWHGHRDLERVFDHIDGAYPDRGGDEKQRADWHLATAMMRGYAARYPEEDFTPVALEKTVRRADRQSGHRRRIAQFHAGRQGRRDRQEGRPVFPARTQDGSLDRLGLSRTAVGRLPDSALLLVCRADASAAASAASSTTSWAKRNFARPRARRKKSIKARARNCMAKSKSGKTSAKQKSPRPMTSFQARLAECIRSPAAFHRELAVHQPRPVRAPSRRTLGTDAPFLDARRRGVFTRTHRTAFTTAGLPYFPLCASNGNPNVIETTFISTAGRTRNCGDADDRKRETLQPF